MPFLRVCVAFKGRISLNYTSCTVRTWRLPNYSSLYYLSNQAPSFVQNAGAVCAPSSKYTEEGPGGIVRALELDS